MKLHQNILDSDSDFIGLTPGQTSSLYHNIYYFSYFWTNLGPVQVELIFKHMLRPQRSQARLFLCGQPHRVTDRLFFDHLRSIFQSSTTIVNFKSKTFHSAVCSVPRAKFLLKVTEKHKKPLLQFEMQDREPKNNKFIHTQIGQKQSNK